MAGKSQPLQALFTKPAPLDIPVSIIPLLHQVHADPSSIDALLHSGAITLDSLRDAMHDGIHRSVTPSLRWDGDPSFSSEQWRICFAAALVLGRAYLISRKHPESLQMDAGEIETFVKEILVLGLFTTEPEIGAPFTVALLVMMCAEDFAAAGIKGKGKQYVWHSSYLELPDEEWNWNDVRAAVMETRNSRTDRTRISYTREEHMAYREIEYIPQIVLDAWARARDCLAQPSRNMTIEETQAWFDSVGM